MTITSAITVQLTSMLQCSLEKSRETTANSLQFAAQARHEARQDLDRIVAYERQRAEAKAEKKALELTLENKILHLQLQSQNKTPPDTVVLSVSTAELASTTAFLLLVDAPAPPPIETAVATPHPLTESSAPTVTTPRPLVSHQFQPTMI